MSRLTVTLTDQEVRALIRLGDIARTHDLSRSGQTALARLTTRIAQRVETIDAAAGGVTR